MQCQILGTAELAGDEVCRKLQINLAREAAEIGEKLGLDFDKFGGASKDKWLQSVDKDIYLELDTMIKKGQTDQTEDPQWVKIFSGVEKQKFYT